MAVVPNHELHERAAALSANLPPLMVAADRVASTVAQGMHGRRRVGQGESFWQYRHYEWGDPIRQIDWRRSGKSDLVYLRENEWEAAQSVWLWCDSSPSMDYSSLRKLPTKKDRAQLLALALGSLLVRGGEHIAPLGRHMRPTMGRTALFLLAQSLAETHSQTGIASLPPFEPLPRYGRVVLISDFLEPLDAMRRSIGLLADRGVDGYVLQILDPSETDLPFTGRTRFEGMEKEGNALIGRVEGVREDYRATLTEHQQGLKDIARVSGWHYGLHITDRPAEEALLRLFVNLGIPREHNNG
jgi:uncharacterized protein (DUF58 family)